MVITVDESVARWARRPIDIGGDSRFQAWVLSPSGVPRITDHATAKQEPELAVLSAVAHGRDADTDNAVQIALAALAEGRAEGRAELILKLLTLRFGELPEATRIELQAARIEELERIAERLLTAASLEEVLGKP